MRGWGALSAPASGALPLPFVYIRLHRLRYGWKEGLPCERAWSRRRHPAGFVILKEGAFSAARGY
jgi:hypothetical protein